MGKKVLLPVILVALIACAQERTSGLKGDYFGQEPPGLKPQVFAPGIISTDAWEGCVCFSCDGKFLVFSRDLKEESEIYISEKKNGEWTKPESAPFFMKPYVFGDFTFAPNELKLYFTSNRPLDRGDEKAAKSNLWVCEYTGNSWTRPSPLEAPLNSQLSDCYPSLSNDGTIYFFRRFDSNNGKSEILSSGIKDGKYSEPVRLGKSINTEWDEWDPAVSPDGEILVFCSKKPGGFGKDDLYVSFKDQNGQWSEALNLGDNVNSSGSENRPFITADNKYIFFTKDAGDNRDAYWMDFGYIEALKPDKVK